MSQSKISLKNILKKALGKSKSEKYMKGMQLVIKETVAKSSAVDLYQHSLALLTDGESEKAINCIIFALDMDRENQLILHLSKTMLFSLTQNIAENGIENQKKKYANNLASGANKLKKKVKELRKIVKNQEKQLEKLEKEIIKNKSNLIFNLFKKSGLKKEIKTIKNNVSSYVSELESDRDELKKLIDLIQKEEFIKVLGLIMEVCFFPNNFVKNVTRI